MASYPYLKLVMPPKTDHTGVTESTTFYCELPQLDYIKRWMDDDQADRRADIAKAIISCVMEYIQDECQSGALYAQTADTWSRTRDEDLPF